MLKKHHIALSILLIIVLATAISIGLAIGHNRQQSKRAKTQNYTLQATSQSTTTTTVNLTKSGPVPASVLVKQGTNIRWNNSDSQAHTIDSSSGLVQKTTLKPKEEYNTVATNPGTYGYVVDGKVGSISVQ